MNTNPQEPEKTVLTTTKHSPTQPHNSPPPVPSDPTLLPHPCDSLHRSCDLRTLTPIQILALLPTPNSQLPPQSLVSQELLPRLNGIKRHTQQRSNNSSHSPIHKINSRTLFNSPTLISAHCSYWGFQIPLFGSSGLESNSIQSKSKSKTLTS